MPLTLDVGNGDGITGPYLDILEENTGMRDAAEFFDFDIRPIQAPLTPHADDFTVYHDHLPEGTELDEFGVGRLVSETFPHGLVLSPWESFTSPKEMLEYPFPTYELSEETVAQIDALHDRGYAVSVSAGSINEWCYYLRGMEEFMADLVIHPEMAQILLDKVTELSIRVGVETARAGADVICYYGDVGGQKSMLMSPKMWREWIGPRWKKIFTAVHQANPDALVFFHSCGFIEPIIPDLIGYGLDILNPVQPETMDPLKIKRDYGDHVALWGGIGLQSTMRKSPDVVRQVARQLIDHWSVESGAIVSIANGLTIDIPWENVLALVETIRTHRPQTPRSPVN
jgi:uroporphyrinogen decarboxylase